jgi:prepilin-type N-terminal cleavage/methylation domain-containing protein
MRRHPTPGRVRHAGLTLIELLLGITLMAIIASVTYFSFAAGTRAWRTGTEMANSLHHADYVLEQLAMGLRSAYYPDAARPSGAYGLTLADGGDGESARDTLGWVKLGTALVGADSPIAGTPHRVEVSVLAPGASDEPGFSEGGLAISAWRIVALPEEFDPKVSVKPMLLTTRVVGFNCRVLDPENNLQEGDAPSAEDELKWDDAWEDDRTNRLPYAVELSLYLDPGREREPPIEVKRIVEIPCAPLSWRDKGAAGGRADTAVPERTAPGRTPRGRVPAQGEEREANPPREDRQPRRATR